MKKITHFLVTFCIIASMFCTNRINAQESVKIGSQTWATKNLNVSTYRNGDSIPQVQDSVAWSKLTTGAWCYYANKIENGTKYGKLYNWYAVNDPRGLAPKSWHIPTNAEWKQLINTVGFLSEEKMRSINGWGDSAKGTNKTGFSGLPGGFRRGDDMLFVGDGTQGSWWCSSEYNSYEALCFTMTGGAFMLAFHFAKRWGFSVRCVRD